jgi:hypothetical protein
VHPVLRWWTWPVVITALFLLLQPVIGSGWAMYPDSYRYAKQVETILGATPAEAHTAALDAFCDTTTSQRTRIGRWVPLVESEAAHAKRAAKCVASYAGKGDVTTTDPRYQQIFTTRPGYPLLATPFVAAFGIADGMRILGLVLAGAGGLLTYAVLRLWRVRATAAAVGQAIYLVSPLGWWALQGLGEGLVSVCILGAVAGVGAVRRGRVRGGLITIAASWLTLGLVRYSTLLLVAAGLAAACAAIAVLVDRADRARRRAMITAAALSAAATVLTLLAMPVFGLPGSDVTLQDTFTKHFAGPLVPNPWYRLAALNYHFWPGWFAAPSSWALLIPAAAGGAALFVWRRDLAWIAAALFAVGVAHIAAHPLPGEAGRLGVLMWLPVVFGLAVAVHALTRRWHVGMTLSRAGVGTDGAAGEPGVPADDEADNAANREAAPAADSTAGAVIDAAVAAADDGGRRGSDRRQGPDHR